MLSARFHGERAVKAPLTWGQAAIWKSVTELAPHEAYLSIGRVVDVPGEVAVSAATAAAAVGRLVQRHESLRTHVRLVDGVPRQDVVRTGSLALDVVESAGDTAAADAKAVRARLAQARFDAAEELPVRAGLVCVDGHVRHVVLVLSHLAVDLYAMQNVVADLSAMLTGTPMPDQPGLAPVDLARRQQHDPAPRSRRCVDYWLSQYEQTAPAAFPVVAPAADPPYAYLVMSSPALCAATQTVAERCRVTTSTVLLAATAAVLGVWSGRSRCALATVVNNRFQPGHREMVSPMNQLGLFVVDLTDVASLDEVVSRAWRSALRAQWHAYYDQVALDRAVEQPPFCFNDVRLAADVPPAPARPHAPTTLTAGTGLERFSWQASLGVHDAPDGFALSLAADTRRLPSEAMGRFLTDIERLVVAAARDSQPMARPAGSG